MAAHLNSCWNRRITACCDALQPSALVFEVRPASQTQVPECAEYGFLKPAGVKLCALCQFCGSTSHSP